MIVFLNEDQAYLQWVRRHREGFVLAGRRWPKLGQFKLHRASCCELRASDHPTKGSRLLAVSAQREELEDWASQQSQSIDSCDTCRPSDAMDPNPAAMHLSPLAREVLDYVVESAEIHFGRESPPYKLSIEEIAGCFAKTPGQLSHALHQLTDHGLTELEGRLARHGKVAPRNRIYPTLRALLLCGSYESSGIGELEAELARLHPRPTSKEG